jgi:hypothetical protein
MRKLLLEMIDKARLNRQRESTDGDEKEDLLETLEDPASSPDKEFELEELRRLVLEERKKFRDDPCFTEIVRKILYERYDRGEAIAETMKEMGVSRSKKSTYYRWFSKIELSIDKLHTKNRKGEDEANGKKR